MKRTSAWATSIAGTPLFLQQQNVRSVEFWVNAAGFAVFSGLFRHTFIPMASPYFPQSAVLRIPSWIAVYIVLCLAFTVALTGGIELVKRALRSRARIGPVA